MKILSKAREAYIVKQVTVLLVFWLCKNMLIVSIKTGNKNRDAMKSR